jgi:hypothetical protein
MNKSFSLKDRVDCVFHLIHELIWDNTITESDFQRIQELKVYLHVTSEQILEIKKEDIERILIQQFHLLLLDKIIDKSERQEIEWYKEIFGYSEGDIDRFEAKDKQDNEDYAAHLKQYFKPNSIETLKRKRIIPASIERIVWDRDGGKCVLCGSMNDIEFDHDIPFSLGGANTIGNIRLLCRNCNRKKSDSIGWIDNEHSS